MHLKCNATNVASSCLLNLWHSLSKKFEKTKKNLNRREQRILEIEKSYEKNNNLVKTIFKFDSC